ncbi:hypothetical protein Bca101_082849 [Brassica carinata]
MNPSKQDVKLLLTMLPKIWKVEDRVVGADLGLGRFQFDFDQKEDIEQVLKMQPFHFDYWMLSLVRWQPRVERNYPNEITFWVRVLGVPLQLWAAQTFEIIGGAIGRVIEVDVDYGRVQVVVDGYKNLVFETEVNFHGGEHYDGNELQISLRYEKLFGYCRSCFSLCHDIHKCHANMEAPEKRLESQVEPDVTQGDRCASYKGVVINGTDREGHQGKPKQDSLAKGKGKMHEEEDLRWINVSDQKQGRDNSSRGRYRGEERPSNYRGSYTERARPGFQEDRSLITSSRGVRRERERSPREFFHYRERSYVRRSELNRNGSEQNAGQSRVQEHGGNVVNMEGCGDDASQKEEKEELLPVEDSLDLANEVLEAMNITEGDKGMEVDAKNGSTDTAVMLKDADEEFQDLTDEESGFKGDTRLVSDVVGEILEKEASKEEGEVEKDFTEEEVGKKQGAKKKTFKAGIAGASIAKKRLVNAMIQGKRTTSKSSSRQEEGGKKMEEKSSFNSMPSTTK